MSHGFKNYHFVILFIAIAYSFSFCFWGRAGNDPYYWIMLYSGALTGYEGPLSFLSMTIGKWIGCCFGYSLVAYRLVGRVCDLLSVFLPYMLIIPKESRFSSRNLCYLASVIFLLGYGSFNEFSPGTLSVLVMTLIATMTYLFSKNESITGIVAISILTSIAIASRFPNVLVLFIILVYFIIVSKRKVRNLSLYILFTCISFFLLFYVVVGDSNFVSYYIRSFSIAESDPDHTIKALVLSLFNGLNEILIDLSVIVLLLVTSQHCFVNRYANRLLSIILLFVLAYFLRQNIGTHQWYNIRLLVFISSLCLLCGGYLLFMVKQIPREIKCFIVFGFTIMTVIPMGSDTCWMKLFPAYLSLLPVMLVVARPTFSIRQLSMLFLFFCYVFLCFSNNNISHGQEPLLSQSEKIEHPVLAHTHVSNSDKQYIERILSDFQQYGEVDNTIYYGTKAHMPYCLTGTKPLYNYGFRMHAVDEKQLNQVKDVLQQKKAVLFYMEPITTDFFNSMISDAGYKLVMQDNIYSIYKAD